MSSPIEILTETEGDRGWQFQAQVVHEDGSLRRIRIDLSWADYDWWCPDGSVPPAAVIEGVLQWLIEHPSERPLPERLDASLVRRMHRDADRDIRRMLSPGGPP
jgi:hypothetical protein